MEPKDRLPIGISLLALAVAIAALVVAVSDSDSDDAVDESETSVTASAPATTQALQTTTTVRTVQTLAPAPTTAASSLVVTATTAAESDGMADEMADDRLVLAVVGLGFDSTLNVRETPGGQIVGKLDSDAAGIVPTGTTREVSGTIWHEVHAAGVVGWVSGEYVTPLGATMDATTLIVTFLGETPSASNMTELGRIVASTADSVEPVARIRISGAPTIGDVGEITMDVVGQADDSIRGYRLHVFATRNSGGSFTLRNVESTVMCYTERGVSAEGLCN